MASAAVTVEDQGEGSKSYSLPLTCDRNSLNVNSPTAKDSQLKEQYPSVNDCSVKVRKPYTITKQRERWTEEEHKKFIEGLKIYGRAWQSIEDHVGTKTAVQIRSHAQKFFSKVARESTNSDADSVKPIEIPPPRPKRKPIHPYPRKLTPHAFESEIMGTADSYAPKVGISQNSSVVDDKQGSSFPSQLASSLEGEGSSLRVQLTANSLPDEDVSVGLRGISKLNIVLPTCNRISLDVSSHNGKDVQLKEQFPSGNGCAIKVIWESSNSDANSVKPIDSSHTSSKSKLVNPYLCKLVGNSAESEILDPTDSNTPIPCLSPVSSAAHVNKGGIFLSQTGSSPEGTGSSFQVQEPACSSPDMKTNAADKKVLSNSGTVLLTCNKFSLKAGLQSGPNEQVHSGNGSATKVVHESGNSEAHSVKPTENAALCLKKKVHHAFPCELSPAAFESKTHGTKDSLTPSGSFSPHPSAGDANQAGIVFTQAGPSPEGTGSSFNIQLPDSSPDGDVPVDLGGSKSSTVLRTCSRTPLDVGTNSGMDIQQEQFHAGIGCALKARKPYTITKQRERWTEEEHGRFIEALKLYGRAWRKIEEHVGTKTAIQIRSHAQKFFSKVVRESVSSDVNSVKTIEIPPPRPKRKPVHPYPRKLAAPFESEMQCTADSKTPNDFLSPVSSAVDANNDCFLYSQPDSSPEGTGSSFQIQQPASSPLDEEVPKKSEKLSQEEPPVTTESLADLASTQSLKLFGKTVVVADTKGPSLPTAGTSESSPLDMNGGRPAHIVPWNLVPPVGTWDPSLNYFMQFPNEIPTRADGSVPSLPWCAFYVGLPFPSLQMQNPVVVNPGASVRPGLSEDREVHQEGSYSGSDAGSVNAGEGRDRDWDVEIQSDKVASDNGENERQTEGGGDFCGKTSPTELKPRPDKCMKGFVPYKRCITERETQSSNMTVQDSDERRIRLCL